MRLALLAATRAIRLDAALAQVAAVKALHRPWQPFRFPGVEPLCVGCLEAGGEDGVPLYSACPTLAAIAAHEEPS